MGIRVLGNNALWWEARWRGFNKKYAKVAPTLYQPTH
jgi:hypothetical protein